MAEVPKRLSVDDCRRKAEECRDLARHSKNPEHCIMLAHMAGTWDRIAEDIKKTGGFQQGNGQPHD